MTADAQGAALDRVVAALEARGFGPVRNGMARCPAHHDRNPSLSVSRGDRGALIHCFTGCDPASVLEAIGLASADLFDEPPQGRTSGPVNGKGHAHRARREPARAGSAPVVEDLGPPTSDQVETLQRSRRIADPETPSRVGARLVRAWGKEWLGLPNLGGGWKLWAFDAAGAPEVDDGKLRRRNVGPVSCLLSPDLRSPGAAVDRLWDVEGESDALAMIDQGMRAVIAGTGGATTLAGHDRHRAALLALRAGEVAVVGDRDPAGRAGAEKRAAWWLAQGVAARIVELPETLGEGGDVRDYLLGRFGTSERAALDSSGGPADLDTLADAALLRTPNGDREPAPDAGHERGSPELELVGFTGGRLLALLGRPAPPPVEAARPVPGHFATLVAPPMVGKTTLALWNAMARASGVAPWLGAEPRSAGRVLIFSLDEAPEQVARRMNGLCVLHPGGYLEKYVGNLTVIGPDRELDPSALDALRFDERGLATLARWLEDAERAGQPFAEVYVDAYADVIPLGETENSNEEATRIGGALERLAVRFGCAIVLLHHTGKPKPDAGDETDVRWMGRGASALSAKARAVISLEFVQGMPHLRRVRTATNLGPAPRATLFQVCSEEAQQEELLFFRPAEALDERDPSEFLAVGESISTTQLARRLAGDALPEDKEPPGEMKRLAQRLRDRWHRAGLVCVKPGKQGAKMIALAEQREDRP